MKTETTKTARPNLDPITGAPGAHPVGTGIGAAAGGAAVGAAVGTAAGPVGTGIGMIAGAIVGGLAGKAVAENVDPTVEDKYWRVAYEKADYVGDSPYETYQPAYRMGFENYTAYPGKTFDEVEPELQSKYEKAGYEVGLEWAAAREAARDAWKRLEDRFKSKPNKLR